MRFTHSTRYKQLATGSLVAAIAMLPFSYYPLASFGSIHGVHIDASLLYVAVLVATTISLPLVLKRREQLFRSKPLVALGAFWLFCSISSLSWSDNLFRGVATAAFLLLLIGFACTIATGLPELKKHQKLLYRLLASTIGVSIIWALWQIYGDALGVSAIYTLLPAAYQSPVFGVARPTAFALEPQFFASLLIIPLFWLVWQYVKIKPHTKPPLPLIIALVTVSSTLLLTLSRGGIYAAVLGFAILILLEHRNLKRWLSLAAILVTSIVVSTFVVFSAASINQQHSTSGYESMSKIINHLSLGTFNLPSPSKPSLNSSVAPPSTKKNSGYVSSSTDSRTSMSEKALSLWAQNPQTIMLGVGIGGFGVALHEQDARFSKGSVVNNYYIELLAETGLVGISLFVTFLGALLYQLALRRQSILIVLLVSLLIQLCFFSGNANIIHLWTLIGVVVSTLYIQPKNKRYLVQ